MFELTNEELQHWRCTIGTSNKEQQASLPAFGRRSGLVAAEMRLSYKSREKNAVLTFWLSSCPEGNVILSLSKGVSRQKHIKVVNCKQTD